MSEFSRGSCLIDFLALYHDFILHNVEVSVSTGDLFCSYLRQKIDCYRQEHHVVDLIHLFRDVVFFNNNPPRLAANVCDHGCFRMLW